MKGSITDEQTELAGQHPAEPGTAGAGLLRRAGAAQPHHHRLDRHAPGSVRTDCPILEESPVNLECRVTQVIPLGSHDLFLAEVVACDVDESLLDENGKLCLDKAKLIVYSHGEYLSLGKKLGTFGYSVRKKKPGKRKKMI